MVRRGPGSRAGGGGESALRAVARRGGGEGGGGEGGGGCRTGVTREPDGAAGALSESQRDSETPFCQVPASSLRLLDQSSAESGRIWRFWLGRALRPG